MKTTAKDRFTVHRFQPDGVPRWVGGPQSCLECPMPEENEVHHVTEEDLARQLPDRDPDERALEERRVGDH
jgi:hypothetical protein